VNTVLTNITHATTSATGIGTASGLPAGVTAAWSANVITISGTPTASGTFNYTIPLTGTSCIGVNATGTITVSAPVCPATIAYNSYTYNTGSIGTQCWMLENLRTRLYNDNTAIRFDTSGGSLGTTSQTWSVLTYGAHTIYAHDSTLLTGNLAKYGYLYNWYAAKGIATVGSTTYKNICPTGWHVPTDPEWSVLELYLNGGLIGTGNMMKSTGNNTASTGLWNAPNAATNSSGFTALPGGVREGDPTGSSSSGLFAGPIGNFASFWSATASNSSEAWTRDLVANSGNVDRAENTYKSTGASVRCLRD
jgi:uncharacterized protein (TIGR02145 family)